jgi:hypothetical protein
MNRYLVRADYIDPGPLLDAESQERQSRERIAPGQAALAALEAEGTIVAGGVPPGVRSVVFIADVEDNDALGDLLGRLPIWGINHWTVEPLQTFSARAAQTRRHSGADEHA